MYTVAVRRELVARHFLVGGDFGHENSPHAHTYRIEFRLAGNTLDEHGFLVDIDAVAGRMDAALPRFRDALLNDLPEFRGLNPSVEHLARILCRAFRTGLTAPGALEAAVTVRESADAWAAFSEPLA